MEQLVAIAALREVRARGGGAAETPIEVLTGEYLPLLLQTAGTPGFTTLSSRRRRVGRDQQQRVQQPPPVRLAQVAAHHLGERGQRDYELGG